MIIDWRFNLKYTTASIIRSLSVMEQTEIVHGTRSKVPYSYR